MDNHNRNEDEQPIGRRSSARKKSTGNIFVTLLKVLVLIALVFGTCAATYAAKLVAEFNGTVNEALTLRKKDGTVVNNNDTVDPLNDPISILILGIDDNAERNLGSSRTDSMILTTINPKTKAVDMVSIPRDTYTKIETTKYNEYDKINSAFTYGGAEGSISTVEALTNVPVTFYVTVDFQALVEVVDALGGIEVDVPIDIYEHYASETDPNSGRLLIAQGTQTLSGEQALVFSRYRKVDNDIERGKRQLIIIQKIIEKALQVGSISKYSDVLKSIKGHFWTDMSMDTILSIAQAGMDGKYTFSSYAFDWLPDSTGGYVGIYKDSLDYISHKMRVALGLDKADERDATGYKFKSDLTTVSPKTPVDSEITGGSGGATTIEDENPGNNGYTNYNNGNTGWSSGGGYTQPSSEEVITSQEPETNNGTGNSEATGTDNSQGAGTGTGGNGGTVNPDGGTVTSN